MCNQLHISVKIKKIKKVCLLHIIDTFLRYICKEFDL